MNITKKRRNHLLKRHEISAFLSHSSNPGVDVAASLLAEVLKVQKEQIALKALKSKFGGSEFFIDAFVYDSPEDKLRIEPPEKVIKKEGAQ